MNNAHVLVSGSRLRLVPYLAHHVPRYYEWMGDTELMQCTASERLTLEEEYENQRDWLCAEDKLTFILLAPLSVIARKPPKEIAGATAFGTCTAVKGPLDDGDAGDGEAAEGKEIVRVGDEGGAASLDGVGPKAPGARTPSVPVRSGRTGGNCEAYVMVGDCNLFRLGGTEAELLEDEEAAPSDAKGGCFEVAVMMAERTFRRQGVGEEAVRLLMSYAIDKLGASVFVAKILNTNTPSIRLFTEKLGFTLLKEVPVFRELHFVRRFVTAAERAAWMSAAGYAVSEYDATTEEALHVLYSVPNTG
ncbi:putative N-acetyltransferase [Trypanosoma conorhini]|uniref:Putative N-acetyltransferase n=1 Tax=Trypanosoma conorhini TaxID=83891 RepID=A0A3S5IUK6_9TRYP|nr:putative N-acetyltransferase [Trypanosoma conorhini]RNF26426.1 putative N-acetyltransferase [Trypanosoma conorhini]